MNHTVQDSDEVPLLAALPVIQRLIMSSFNMKTFNYTKTQLTIFSVLSQHESLTMTQIAEYISSSNEQATRAVAPLVDAGYVERFIEPDNRTKVHVRLTPAGEAYIAERTKEYYACLKKRLENSLSPQDRKELAQAVNTIINIMDRVE